MRHQGRGVPMVSAPDSESSVPGAPFSKVSAVVLVPKFLLLPCLLSKPRYNSFEIETTKMLGNETEWAGF